MTRLESPVGRAEKTLRLHGIASRQRHHRLRPKRGNERLVRTGHFAE